MKELEKTAFEISEALLRFLEAFVKCEQRKELCHAATRKFFDHLESTLEAFDKTHPDFVPKFLETLRAERELPSSEDGYLNELMIVRQKVEDWLALRALINESAPAGVRYSLDDHWRATGLVQWDLYDGETTNPVERRQAIAELDREFQKAAVWMRSQLREGMAPADAELRACQLIEPMLVRWKKLGAADAEPSANARLALRQIALDYLKVLGSVN